MEDKVKIIIILAREATPDTSLQNTPWENEWGTWSEVAKKNGKDPNFLEITICNVKFCCCYLAFSLNNNQYLIILDRENLVPQGMNWSDVIADSNFPNLLIKVIEVIFNNLPLQNSDKEFVVAIHGIDNKVIGNLNGPFKSVFKDTFKSVSTYTAAIGGNSIKQAIEAAWKLLNSKKISEAINKLWDTLDEEVKKKTFFELTYFISSTLLPLYIDMMGIEQVEGEKKREYFQEVLKQRNSGSAFQNKINNLQYAIAGVKIGSSSISLENSIEDIDQEKEDINGENLLKLSGLKKEDSKIGVDEKSPIVEFFKKLDEVKVDKVEEIENFFKNKNWEVNKKNIDSFHCWIFEIMNCLNKIGKKFYL